MPWTYRYSVDEQCGLVKLEPEDYDAAQEGEGGEEASWASLYAGHSVKEELVFGPEQLQPQDIAISMQYAQIRIEDPHSLVDPCSLGDPCSPVPTYEARTEPASSPILSGEPYTDKTLQQLAYCFVRLERIVLDEQNSSSLCSPHKPITCDFCDRKFALKSHLNRHLLSHRNLICHICQKKSSKYATFVKHMEQHKLNPYTCNVCHKLFTKSSELAKHKRMHTRNSLFCNICQIQFISIKNWQDHRTKQHSQKPEDSMEQTHLDCDLCNETFISKPDLHIHMQKHHPVEKIKKHHCSICNKMFKQGYLTNHMLGHLKPHHCDTCAKSFMHGSDLESHIRLQHLGEKMYHCKTCPEQFSTNQELYVHKKEVHTAKERPFSCKICHERFISTRGLLSHMRMHLRNKLYKNDPNLIANCCNICQIGFGNTTAWRNHKRKHQKSKEKRHICPICQKRFRYRKKLRGHMLYKHRPSIKQHIDEEDINKRKPHSCDICQVRFLRKQYLLNHIEKQHPKPIESNDIKMLTRFQKQLKPDNIPTHKPEAIESSNLIVPPSTITIPKKDVTQEKPHCCKICQMKFVYRKTLHNHMQARHPQQMESINMQPGHQEANESNEQVISPSTITDHQKDLTPEKRECCEFCQKRFVYRKTLLTHLQTRHPQQNESNNMQFGHQKANESNEQGTPPSTVTDHQKDLTPEKRECCEFCQKRFVYRKSLLTHLQTRHPQQNESNNIQFGHQEANESNEQVISPSTVTDHQKDLTPEKRECCEFCQKRFLYRKTLLTHLQTRHPKLYRKKESILEKSHCCKICQMKFVYRKTLHNHMQARHPQDIESNNMQSGHQEANESNEPVISPSAITDHQKDLTPEKRECCEFCQKRFLYRKTLLTHLQTRHPKLYRKKESILEKSHCCKICQMKFVYRKTLHNHMQARHPQQMESINMQSGHQEANESNEQVISPSAITDHQKDLTPEKRECCEFCQKRFVYRKTLLTHLQTRHPQQNQSLNMESGHQKANKCNEQILPPSAITNEKRDLTQNKLHRCSFCRKRFLHKKVLLNHMEKRHQKKIKRIKHSTQTHESNMASEHQEANESNEQVTPPSTTTDHQKDLSPEKRECCEFCQKRFMYRKTLLTHLQTRHPQQNESNNMQSGHQEANESNEQAIPPSTVTDHQKDLTPEKRECCEFCQKRFLYRKTLLTHLQTRHPKLYRTKESILEKSHCCKICQMKFVYRKTLHNHMQARHPQQMESINMQSGHQEANESNEPVISPSAITDHQKDLTPEKRECCEFCQKRFVYRKTMLTHLQTRHPQQNQSLNMESGHQKANKCNEQILPPSAITNEKKDLTQNKLHRCSFCRKRFVHKKVLLNHMEKRHQKKIKRIKHSTQTHESNMESGHQEANESNEQVTPPSTTTDHQKDLTPEKRECCEFCQKRFVYRKSLLTHLQTRHPQQNESNNIQFGHQEANESNEQVTPPSAITDHQKDLTPEKRECCEFCQKRFLYRKTLLTHLQTRHPKLYRKKESILEKSHCCKICQMKFVYRKTLHNHMQARHPQQIESINMQSGHQEANESNEPVISPSAITDHQKDLTPEKRECCEFCQKRFVYRKTMLTHLQTRHPQQNQSLNMESGHQKANKCNEQILPPSAITNEKKDLTQNKLHRCSFCRKRFVHKKVLLNHMEKRHQKKIKRIKHSTQTHESNMASEHQEANESNEQVTPPPTTTDHQKDLSPEKRECCEFCQKRFVYRKTLLTHLQTRHPQQNESNNIQFGHQEANESNEQVIPLSTVTDHQKDLTPEKRECCEFCQKRFVYRKTLLTHLQTRHPKLYRKKESMQKKPHCCEICQISFAYRKSLFNHMQTRHSKPTGNTQPNESTKNTTNGSSISNTQNKDLTQEKPIRCEFCEKTFVRRKAWHRHMVKRHRRKMKSNKPKPRQVVHCCEICQKYFALKKLFLAHMQQHTEYESNIHVSPPFSLEENNEKLTEEETNTRISPPLSFKVNEKLTEDESSFHVLPPLRFEENSEKPTDDESNIHVSPAFSYEENDQEKIDDECCKPVTPPLIFEENGHKQTDDDFNENVTSLSSLTNHNKYIKREKHCCNICQKRFLYKKSLVNHMLKRHQKKIESKMHSTRTQAVPQEKLNTPLSVPIKEKSLSCKICPERFLNRRGLLNHMRKHLRIKLQGTQPPSSAKSEPDLPLNETYSCDVCQKRPFSQQDLLTHMKTQHPTVLDCNTQLPPKSNLGQQKPYCCEICRQTFSRRPNLLTHIRRRHLKEKPYCCKSCQKRFMYPVLLHAHMRKEHRHVKSQEKTHYCNICQKRFWYKKSWVNHMLKRHQKKIESKMHSTRTQAVPQEKLNTPLSVPIKEKSLSCKICPERFLNRRGLLNHMRKHLRIKLQGTQPPSSAKSEPDLPLNETYSCDVCQKRPFSQQDLLTHMKTQHPTVLDCNTQLPPKSNLGQQKPYCCEICRQTFSRRPNLLTHIRRRHLKEKPYCCKSCQKRFMYPVLLHAHMRKEHRHVKSQEKTHCCNICQKRFWYKKSWVNHMLKRHQKKIESKIHSTQTQAVPQEKLNTPLSVPIKEKSLSCKICPERFLNRRGLLNHMRKHLRIKLQGTQPPSSAKSEPDLPLNETYSCDVCQKRPFSQQDLLTHMKTQHPTVLDCNTQLSPKSNLGQQKPYCCEICRQTFSRRPNLLTHIRRRHLKEKPYCCKLCQKRFMYPVLLHAHMRKEHRHVKSQEKNHCCHICQKRFRYEKVLDTHIKNHTRSQLNPYCCDICRLRFVNIQAWQNHMRKHEEAKKKPHLCIICQTRFKFRKTLRSHMRKQHQQANKQHIDEEDITKRKPHSCDICKVRFLRKQVFLNHIENKHPKPIETNNIKMRRSYPKPFKFHNILTHKPEAIESNNLPARNSVANEFNNMQTGHQTATETNKLIVPPSTITIERKDLTREKSHCCKICQMKFVYRKSLNNHMQARHTKPNKPNKMESGHQTANESNEPSIPLSTVTDHQKDVTPEKRECCEFCQKRFVYRKSLLTHLETRHPKQYRKKESMKKKPHCCEICQISFAYRKSLFNHMHKRHSKPNVNTQPNEPKRITKNGASKRLTLPSTLSNQNKDLIQEQPTHCEFCEKTFVRKKMLLRHMVKKHRRKMKSNKPKPRQVIHCCEICQKYFALKKLFLAHMQQHTEYEASINFSPPFTFEENNGKLTENESNIQIKIPLSFEENEKLTRDESNIHVLSPSRFEANNENCTEDESNMHVSPPFSFEQNKEKLTEKESSKYISPPPSFGENGLDQLIKDDKSNKQVTVPFGFEDSDQHDSEDESNNQSPPTPPFTFDVSDQERIDDESNNDVIPPNSGDKIAHLHTEDESNKQDTPFNLDESDEDYTDGKCNKQVIPPNSGDKSAHLHTEDESNIKLTPPSNFDKNGEHVYHTDDESNQQITPFSLANHDQVNTLDTSPTAGQSSLDTSILGFDSPAGCDTYPNQEYPGFKVQIYSCNICHKQFAYENNFIKHVQQHNEIKLNEEPSPSNFDDQKLGQRVEIHCCNVCQKRFAYEDSLLTHMKQHTNNPTGFTTIQYCQSKNVLLRQ